MCEVERGFRVWQRALRRAERLNFSVVRVVHREGLTSVLPAHDAGARARAHMHLRHARPKHSIFYLIL